MLFSHYLIPLFMITLASPRIDRFESLNAMGKTLVWPSAAAEAACARSAGPTRVQVRDRARAVWR